MGQRIVIRAGPGPGSSPPSMAALDLATHVLWPAACAAPAFLHLGSDATGRPEALDSRSREPRVSSGERWRSGRSDCRALLTPTLGRLALGGRRAGRRRPRAPVGG